MADAKTILDKLKQDKSKNTTDYLLDKTRGTIVGTGIGITVGVFIGWRTKSNLLVSGFLGGLAGGVLSRIIITRKPKEDESD